MKLIDKRGNVINHKTPGSNKLSAFDSKQGYLSIGFYLIANEALSLSGCVHHIKKITNQETKEIYDKIRENDEYRLYSIGLELVKQLKEVFRDKIVFVAEIDKKKGFEEDNTHLKVAKAWASRRSDREKRFLELIIEDAMKSSIPRG